jgi:hypothetical protein
VPNEKTNTIYIVTGRDDFDVWLRPKGSWQAEAQKNSELRM